MPTYEGRRGHPLLFSARYRDDILTHYEDVGLRGLLHTHPEDVLEWAAPNATVLSDRIETDAIKRVFGDHARRLSISSTKAATGHLLCASGPAEIIFSTLAMQHGIVPPTLNYEQPDPCCDLDYTPNQARKREIRAAISLSLGLSGESAAVLIRNAA